ncbi:MAG: hypothetical protein N4A45_01115 [Flavobacteriales bacterium]|jgi:hypothetical protein|nr:hypothetical protein [Flavobacteriales bacterium]
MKNTVIKLSLLIVVLSSVASCLSKRHISETYDHIKDEERATLVHYYNQTVEHRTRFYDLEQRFLKITKDKNFKLKVFDRVSLEQTACALNTEIFWIIDDEVFPVEVKKMPSKDFTNFVPQKQKIATLDSSKVEVLSDIKVFPTRKVTLIYHLRPAMIKAIKKSKYIAVRYYSEEEMITVPMKKRQRKQLRSFVR